MKIIIFISLIILMSSILTADEMRSIELKKGVNEIKIENYFYPILASSLVYSNKNIKSITLKNDPQDLGYINLFGGIGTDFFFESGKTYELYVTEDTVLYLMNY